MIEQYKIKPQNGIFTIYKIPFWKIERANVSLKNKDKYYSLKKHCDEQGWDIGVNGAMFDMRTYQNVTDLIVNGKLDNGGNYSNVGLAFGNDFPRICAYSSTTQSSKGNPVDFIGGAPTLIVDGKINMDTKGIEKSFSTRLTQRTALGIDQFYVYILSTLGNKASLKMVAEELFSQGCINAINLDGGGSTSLCVNGKIQRVGRNIPTAFGIKLEEEKKPTQKPSVKKVAIDSGHSKVVAGKRSFDGTLLEYEFNFDVANRIKNHLERHGVESKVFQIEDKVLKSELNERCKQINSFGADVCVSIHANAYGSEWNAANGWEAYCYKLTGEGKKLADCIHKESIPYLGLTDRRVKDGSKLAVVRDTTMPCCLIEHGFYTNKTECEKLKSDSFREKCAVADAKGILDYFGIEWIEPKEPRLYRVQVGAFSKKENAERLKNELEQKGYKPFVV